MDEPLIDVYYAQLKTSTNPSATLVSFYQAVFSITADSNLYKLMARLTRIYGTEIMFMSILDCSEVDGLDTSNLTGLITYFAKKRTSNKFNFNFPKDLTKQAKENISRMVK